MADITMCVGELCPNKLSCYRYTAPANPWRQSYFMETPWKPGQDCVEFIPNEIKKEKKHATHLT